MSKNRLEELASENRTLKQELQQKQAAICGLQGELEEAKKHLFLRQRDKPGDCPYCRERGKTWQGDDPKCAFRNNGIFGSNNWNCATMNRLRSIAEKLDLNYRDDLAAASFGAVPFEGDEFSGYIAMTWYKNRGQTGNALVMCDDYPARELTEEIASLAIQYWIGQGMLFDYC